MWFLIAIIALAVIGKFIDNSKKKSAPDLASINKPRPVATLPTAAENTLRLSPESTGRKTMVELIKEFQQQQTDIRADNLKRFEEHFDTYAAATPVKENQDDLLVNDISMQQCLTRACKNIGLTPQHKDREKITGLPASVFEQIETAFSPRTIDQVPLDDWLAAVILMKEQHLGRLRFSKVFHMTHQSNLAGILTRGLLSHRAVAEYTDISDRNINQSRSRKIETVFRKSIHHYVPFYFNIKNAMLYRVQKEHPDQIAIVEMRRTLCLLPESLFSYHNAAARSATFTSAIAEAAQWEWEAVFSEEWAENEKIKQLMMSEMLIPERVDPLFIDTFHFSSVRSKSRFLAHCAQESITLPGHITLSVSPQRFFTLH
ncbi:DarT ssDNA thymidine ADP-ribosyltransferase family protein [Erwinia sorbitola]|uniref:DUF4433 domain-containing protein n=1 Tax=Erwinia sorbitola TaxID=2681984 RepID=A0A6I6EUJ1_9GAMM|nr:DarT ssDNA thymidine ADP-ribosyltransferase family protein [Erwinia sorbitola]QGU88759.1 DUF4433 domain-containing protein [Erwinia sorbitola]